MRHENNLNLSFGIIALGANLPGPAGSPRQNLENALTMLHSVQGFSITRLSRFWTSPTFPAGAGPDYTNAAATFATCMTASDVLALFHDVEARLARDRSGARWSSRTVDLDLIALDDQVWPDRETQRRWMDLPLSRQMQDRPEQLILPHPRLQDRGFVLAPLAEIAPDWRHPVTGRTVADMLGGLPADALTGLHPVPQTNRRLRDRP